MERKEFDIVVFSLKDKVYRFANSILNNVSDAEDATQDIFEKLWIKRKDINKYKNVESFVIKSTKNLCIDRLRHKKVVRESTVIIKASKPKFTNPDVEQFETIEVVRNTINSLPEKQRIIMHLRDIEGYEFKEISKITGNPVNYIRVNLSRARKSVRKELTKKMNHGL